MAGLVMDLSVEEFRAVVRETVEQVIEERLEDLQALASEKFVGSIAEAREDYRAGRVTALADLIDG